MYAETREWSKKESSIFFMDGRKNNKGGARPGAGRKTKAEILGLAAMIDESWPLEDQKKVLKKLAEDCLSTDFHQRHEARKLLLAYKFGKPKESMDVTSNGETIKATFNISTRSDSE